LKTALLGKGLLAHQNSKLLEWQGSFLQPFDRNLLEKPRALPNDEDLLVGINTQINILSDPIEIHVIASFIKTHGSILANFANEMLSVNGCEPSIGINQ